MQPLYSFESKIFITASMGILATDEIRSREIPYL